ncbi:MAG: Crp/Fnr family transcriptional regulator [Gammaproteobacteria bacterium]|nr:Crp/Fnr family transcriptional regulator [Gammaproteobacteria bacterium]
MPGQRALRRGQHLFWAGDPVTQIWTVQRGSLKTYRISGNGDERVNGFFFAGGVIGWEDLVCGFSQHHCIALEPVTVVNDPIVSILDGALGSPQNQARLLDGIRTEFLRLESILWLEHRTAEERLATFLLWLAASQPNGNGDARTVSLPMSRHDIGSYLGLATETVSRRLTLFHRNGWITLSRRQLRINDVHRLQQIGEF